MTWGEELRVLAPGMVLPFSTEGIYLVRRKYSTTPEPSGSGMVRNFVMKIRQDCLCGASSFRVAASDFEVDWLQRYVGMPNSSPKLLSFIDD